jgi:lipopolysaccharide/colanic/teichoic acid biosynthesis glycosyltransferase
LDEFEGNMVDDNVISALNKIRVERINIRNLSDLYEKYELKIPVLKVNGNWIALKDIVNLEVSYHIEVMKRCIDLFVTILFAPISIMLIALASGLIKLTSKGPVFFQQERVGKGQKKFSIIKLRTMIHNPDGYTEHTIENDKRIYPLGLFLRKSKIDELPQFYNILLGHMSLIGPRPERTEIVNKLIKENPYYELRHLIRPGITGWAQINDPTATPEQNYEKLEYDLFYIKKASILMDAKLTIATINVIWNQKSL